MTDTADANWEKPTKWAELRAWFSTGTIMNSPVDEVVDALVRKAVLEEWPTSRVGGLYERAFKSGDTTLAVWDRNRWYAWASRGRLIVGSELVHEWIDARPTRHTISLARDYMARGVLNEVEQCVGTVAPLIAAEARREALEEAATMLSEIAVVKQGSESPPSMFIGDGYEMASEDVRDLIDKPKENTNDDP